MAIYYPAALPDSKGGHLGLQIRGQAKHLTEQEEIREAMSYLGYEPSSAWQVFKMIPDEVWCFDCRVIRERQRIDLANLNLT